MSKNNETPEGNAMLPTVSVGTSEEVWLGYYDHRHGMYCIVKDRKTVHPQLSVEMDVAVQLAENILAIRDSLQSDEEVANDN